MITLAMDTAFSWLNLALFRDGQLIDGISEPAFKKQSELIFVRLNEMLEKASLSYKDLDRIVITRGPGSYTGVRIAMSIAKVLASRLHIPLYTISTMQLYTGLNSGHVLLDARAKRAFYARIDHGKIERLEILPLEEIEAIVAEEPVYGDASLIGKQASPSDFLHNWIELEPLWTEAKDVHALRPDYLKEYMGHA